MLSSAPVASGGSSALPSLNWPRSSLSTVSKISLRASASMPAARAPAVRPTSVALLDASAAAALALVADSPAATAFASVSVMRPSATRTRSCVSSSVLPWLVTLSFTSPTEVRTNFFVAHAGATLSAVTITPTVISELRMIESLLLTTQSRYFPMLLFRLTACRTGDVTAARPDHEVFLRSSNFDGVPSRRCARLERDQIQVAQFIDHRPRRLVSRRRRAAVIQCSTRPSGEVLYGANRRWGRPPCARGGAIGARIVDG